MERLGDNMTKRELHTVSAIIIIIVTFLTLLFFLQQPELRKYKSSERQRIKIDVNYTGIERKLKK